LAEAEARLRAAGIVPRVMVSRAPRRAEAAGEARVVRVQEDGNLLTVCSFQTAVREGKE